MVGFVRYLMRRLLWGGENVRFHARLSTLDKGMSKARNTMVLETNVNRNLGQVAR